MINKTTLLTHIYNEEYLLPFWLEHHKDMFEDILIIDYRSTDKSLEICKKICPNCKIITTRNKEFDAQDIDNECMDLEKKIEGIKMILNVTEFLLCEKPIKEIFSKFQEPVSFLVKVYTPYSNNNYNINNNYELFSNLLNEDIKYHWDRFTRQIHNFSCGNYTLGRHSTYNPTIDSNEMYGIWLGYYPLNENLLKRKLQIKDTQSQRDINGGAGSQHQYTKDEMLNINNNNVKSGVSLENINKLLYNFLNNKYNNNINVEIINLDNAIITGGSGMIGYAIPFGNKPSSLELNVTNHTQVNEYFEKYKNVSCIIHLVALNLRDSENDPIKAINININGTINMLNIAKKLNIPFIFLSSGAVFSSFNTNMKFCETNIPSPNCIYGSTKYAAENIALTYDKTILIRTGWLFGGNQKSHYKFVEQMYNNIVNDNKVICCNDFYGSTTYVVDLINKMRELILSNMYGIHHVVNDGISTGVDVGELIAMLLDKPKTLIDKRTFNDVPNCGPKRSSTEVIITNNSFNRLRNWQSALTEYILSLQTRHPINTVSIKNIEKYWIKRRTCRLCNSTDINIFFNLEPTPPANHFVNEPMNQEKISLDMAICAMCNHIQLIEILEPAFLYSHYFYVSSTSIGMTKHLKDSVIKFTKILELNKDANILEIGANDGICIKELIDNGFKNILGIDPAKNIHLRHNLPIICDFFGSKSKEQIQYKYKNFKLIYAFHCLAHIEDIQDVFKTIYELLENDGVFVMEVGYFYEVFRTKQFDVIYHEHIDYHTCTAIDKFSRKNGLYLFNVIENNIQGGSIQFYFSKNKDVVINESIEIAIKKEAYIELFNNNILSKWKLSIETICLDMNYIINSFVNSGKKIAAYGASAKSTTFLHQFKISKHIIKYIVDDNIYKQNLYSPGLNIPIKSVDELSLNKVDYIIILSCNFTDEILTKLDIYRKTGLRIIIPFPEIKII